VVTTTTASSYVLTDIPVGGFLSVGRTWLYATTYAGTSMHMVEESVDSGERAPSTMCGLPRRRVPLFMECAKPKSIPKCRTCQKAVDATMRSYRGRSG
jgi:hypothetical protein